MGVRVGCCCCSLPWWCQSSSAPTLPRDTTQPTNTDTTEATNSNSVYQQYIIIVHTCYSKLASSELAGPDGSRTDLESCTLFQFFV